MTAVRHEWWGELRHGGMLVAPQLLDELIPDLPELDERDYDRLRSAWLSLDAAIYGAASIDEARRAFAAQLLEGFLGLEGWQKASGVAAEFKATAMTGEALRPNWALPDAEGDGALLAVWFDASDTVGRGRGVRAQAKLVELLRATGIPLGLLTNGRQFRLVHAGPDYDAWAEWDAQTWFDESEGRDTLRGLAALLTAEDGAPLDRLERLIAAIRESRNRQGDLAQVLGEQVRQGIELLVREVDHKLDADSDLRAALWNDPGKGHRLSDDEALAAIYQAATRVVMRLVLVLYAEARDLLPANVEAYHDSYGVGSLYDTLARADNESRDALVEATAAWPRLLALFRLIYFGSGHADLPVRAYGGQLFHPGDTRAAEPVLRALAALEATRPADAIVYRLLRLLKVGRVKVRAGRGARWVAGAVDFSDLRTEYVGIVYEGLLDYELRRAGERDPVVLLNVGRQPALPLSRLSGLTPSELRELLKTFKKDAASVAGSAESDADLASEEPGEAKESEAEDGDDAVVTADDEDGTNGDDDARARVLTWARDAVEGAGLVRRPKGKSPDLAAYEHKLQAGADKLVAGLIPPGRLYLVASGGLRKGSGSFYTRPALSVPLAQRALEPLCYDRDGERLVPRTPEHILGLKICEPAMGSGSFLVAALRYVVEATHRSLEYHDRIKPKGDRETVVTLPFGAPATGEEREEVFDLPPEDERFADRLRVQLARHVVERCLYGVDRNPMAVELARLALWIETLDRELPFEYLDHKLKVGNTLIGCWLHLVDDYPIRALDREDADGANGERTKWLKQALKDAKSQLPALIDAMGGATPLFDAIDEPVDALVHRVRDRFQALHDLHRGEREQAYRRLLASEEYQTLKQRMDTWCALWFWSAGDVGAPMPRTWRDLTPEQRGTVDMLASEHRFFHWEVEFPDVFRPNAGGFDAVLGNPPWDTVQTEPAEFFGRHDPFYRGYSKTEAGRAEEALFRAVPSLEADYLTYQASFKSTQHFVKAAAAPFDTSLGRGKRERARVEAWRDLRAHRPSLADRAHPFRHQGSGKLFTYKAFLEASHHLGHGGTRIGLIVPAGVYTDKGSTDLRRLMLDLCSWEWCYIFENRNRLFPIHRSYKFGPIVVERGGPTTLLNAAFMRHEVTEWERPEERAIQVSVAHIKRFSPTTWSLMEFKGDRDVDLVERIYGDCQLLGGYLAEHGGRFQLEFMLNTHDRLFVRRSRLEQLGILAEQADTRDPRVRASLRRRGYVPLYEGKSFSIHQPYALGRGQTDSISKFVPLATMQKTLSGTGWQRPRLAFRDIARSTDQRTLISAVIPPAAHANTGPTLDDLDHETTCLLAANLGSLVLDYITRMKVSAHINWLYAETFPLVDWSHSPHSARASELVWNLNAVGAEYAPGSVEPLTTGLDRLVARLQLDATVAHLYGLHPDDLRHISHQFPIYDRDAGDDYRYPSLAVKVYEILVTNGPEAAENRAAELAAARAAAGVGFGQDELWQPEGGWERANAEAREILGKDEEAA